MQGIPRPSEEHIAWIKGRDDACNGLPLCAPTWIAASSNLYSHYEEGYRSKLEDDLRRAS